MVSGCQESRGDINGRRRAVILRYLYIAYIVYVDSYYLGHPEQLFQLESGTFQ
jgi:hypothetical protein